MTDLYRMMWEGFGKNKAEIYLGYKFLPTHRVGLTNYLREEKIYTYLDPQSTDKVLDVGCASGRQIFRIADRIHQGEGVDIADSFVEAARKHAEEQGVANVHFQQALIESLPFQDAQFDKIVCAEVIEHVFNKDVALSELLRVLKAGGTLVISVPNMNADATWYGRLLRFLGLRRFESLETFSLEELAKHGDAHVREFTRSSLRDWLISRGLTVESIYSVSFCDGPYGDWLIKIPLHIGWSRRLIIGFENFLTQSGCFWGRHLVVKARKG